MESPNPQLKEGLVLVDTPGIGSLNTEHTAITYAFIPNADAILS
jgi:putative ribosome biogenesis GTPase RsgA